MKHFTKILLLCLAVCSQLVIHAQSTQAGLFAAGHMPGLGGVPVRYVGWDASLASNAIPLSIEHRGTNNINFFTGAVQRMTILGTASGATQGFVGINTPSPNQLFTVSAGNINVTNTTQNNGYMIGNVMTLWRGSTGNITNIFVGANSGTANTVGTRNTFVGNNSGIANTTAPDNTFIGFNTGLNNR